MADLQQNDGNPEIPQKGMSVEFMVGLFALIGIGCFSYLSINIAGMSIFHHGYYQVTAVFDNVAGLKLGAPVEIAGVGVGEVRNIELDKTVASVTMDIREGVVLRDDDIAAIRTKGIIGDRYVKVLPGGSDTTLATGGKIETTEPAVELEEILGKIIHKL